MEQIEHIENMTHLLNNMSNLETYNIFYAQTQNESNQRALYFGIIEKLKKNKQIHFFDCDDGHGTYKLDNKIYLMIDKCDLFIADITPEKVNKNNTTDMNGNQKELIETIYNPNVMNELGYALGKKNWEQILIIYNSKNIIPENLPFNIKNFHVKDYSVLSEQDLTVEINNFSNKKTSEIWKCYNKFKDDFYSNDWKNANYKLNSNFLNILNTILDVNLNDYTIRYNSKQKKAYIWLHTLGNDRSINIMTKIMYLPKDKYKDLSQIDVIHNELKHLEIIAYVDWFKQ